MQVKNLMLGIIAFAGITQMASAGTAYTCNVSNGNWDDSSTWSPSGVPGLNDKATIGSSQTVTVRFDQGIGILRLQNGGTINVNSSKKLTIDGTVSSPLSDAAGQHLFAGAFNLSGAGSTLQFTSRDHNLSDSGAGTGIIRLANASAVFAIDSTYKVTNEVAIAGMGVIRETSTFGAATLENKQVSATAGAVLLADDSGELSFEPSLILNDVNYAIGGTFRVLYKADGASAAMRFGANPGVNLKGNFVVNNGAEMRFDDDITTDGSLTLNDGCIDTDTSCVTFDWASGYQVGGVATVLACDHVCEP